MPVAATKPAIAPPQAEGIFRSIFRRSIFRSPAQYKLVLSLLLVVVMLALYNPVSRNGFVNFDDDRYVTQNPHVLAGLRWSTVAWAFTSFEQANWHPLTWLSHALDYQLFQLNPVGHHYTNLLLHVANVLLLFLILQWFTGYTARSLMVAALFALHPLNVESVAWVAERKNVLCMFFLLLAIAAYGWYVRRPGVARYLLVAVLFAMALMSKPMAITLPLLLFLLDYWPLGRMRFPGNAAPYDEGRVRFAACTQSMATLCVEKLPLLALSVGSAVITMIAQRGGGAVLTSAARSPMLRFENVIVSYALYIQKAIWPSHLAALYPYPHALPAWEVAASAMFLLALTYVALRYRQHRYLAVGWFWYLGTMVPMIGLVQVGNQAMADRYAYLPLIGFFIVIVWAAADWVRARQPSARYMAVAGISILVAFSAVTCIQLGYWHDDFSLWSHALVVTRNNYVAENNFANALVRQGRIDEAIIHFRTAAVLEPLDPTSQLNLGIYAEQHGDLAQAAVRYDATLQLATDTQLRATAYANLGTVYFALHDYGRAQQNFDSAVKLKGTFPVAFLDMGLIAEKTAQTGADWNRAAGYFAQSAALDPTDVGYLLLADALHRAGRAQDADLAYRQALQLASDISQSRQRAVQLLAQ
jgi:tetratricopeptide (TPR) repeat protein